MPEGPELHLASRFVNCVCKGKVFSKIAKSPIHKCSDVCWDSGDFTISASSRGKEMKLTMTPVVQAGPGSEEKTQKKLDILSESLDILFTFGMSGRFNFCEVEDMEKHSHLNFYTKSQKGLPAQVLSFVDYRRFGKWNVGGDWSSDRGPCVLLDYPAFRENVLQHLQHSAFSKPICEVMLNQKYFNGIGNYLRAEILYRLSIRPFERARDVLKKLVVTQEDGTTVPIKSETSDILSLCHQLAEEVVDIGATAYGIYEDKSSKSFTEWLQCYYQPNMKNMADHNKRTIWFTGDPGPLTPKEQTSRRMNKPPKNKKRKIKGSEGEGQDDDESPSKKPKPGGKVTRSKLSKAIKTKETKTPSSKQKTGKLKSAGSKSKESDEDTVRSNPKSKRNSGKKTSESRVKVKEEKPQVNGDLKTNPARTKRRTKAGFIENDGQCDQERNAGKLPKKPIPKMHGLRRVTRSCSRDSCNSTQNGQ